LTVHNLLLCSVSACLLTGLLMALAPEAAAAGGGAAGFMRVWCDPAPHALTQHRSVAFFYANYITKYYVRAALARYALTHAASE
jgi:hypothetical protein